MIIINDCNTEAHLSTNYTTSSCCITPINGMEICEKVQELNMSIIHRFSTVSAVASPASVSAVSAEQRSYQLSAHQM